MTFPGLQGFPSLQQNTNFIEALFKHGMKHGWESIGVMFVIQLYLFLSLDNIKAAFIYVNDKIALHGKNKLEQYCGHLANGTRYLWSMLYAFFLNWIAAFPIWLSKKWRRVKPTPTPVTNAAPMTKPKPNQHTIKLDPSNTIDIMSLCHYVLSNKRTLQLHPRTDRIASTRKTTSEVYALPNNLRLGKVGDIKISLAQHIGLKMESESDHAVEKIKKFTYDRDDAIGKNKPKKGKGFSAMRDTLKKLWGDKAVYFDDPQFWFEKEQWSCDPESMSNNEFTDMWRVLYYLGDLNIIRKFILYLTGQDGFRLDGRTFEKSSDDKIDDFSDSFSNKATVESFLAEVPAYNEAFVKKLDEQGTRSTVDEMAKKFLSKYQSGKGDGNTKIALKFTSKTYTEHQLSKFARQWYHKQITTYYNTRQKKKGEKVQIYKLYINYDTHMVEVPNPKYIEWEKEQEEERRRKEQGTDESKDKDSKDSKDTKDSKDATTVSDDAADDADDAKELTRSGKKRSKKKSRRQVQSDSESSSSSEEDEWDDEYGGMYNLFDTPDYQYQQQPWHQGRRGKKKGKHGRHPGAYGGYWNGPHGPHGPHGHGVVKAYKPVPSKTIKVEKKIPSAQAKLIKSDRKPLEYLYLPDDQMQNIVQYLQNFRERRDRFEQYGFPYRGGIILSGVPGCGKSSTILATATYLQKSIYYLDLGQIKTNHELKLCVDYIRTNSSNGGVIIFEDIDCMTNIVHQRSDHLESVEMTTKTNITTIADEDDCPLSLSYLLNVLDGTMAPEDVLFIMTTNHVEKLDKALIRPGRIDLDIELTKCTRVQLAKIYHDLYNKDLSPDILAQFPEKHWIIAKVILHLFHNSFDANVDQYELIKPLLNTEEDKLGKLGEWE